jgi:hypothetical protein
MPLPDRLRQARGGRATPNPCKAVPSSPQNWAPEAVPPMCPRTVTSGHPPRSEGVRPVVLKPLRRKSPGVRIPRPPPRLMTCSDTQSKII